MSGGTVTMEMVVTTRVFAVVTEHGTDQAQTRIRFVGMHEEAAVRAFNRACDELWPQAASSHVYLYTALFGGLAPVQDAQAWDVRSWGAACLVDIWRGPLP